LTITSNTGSSAWCAQFSAGKLTNEIQRVGADIGTTVCISNIFSDNKARKFLTDLKKDSKKITSLCWKYSFFHSGVKWIYKNNDSTLFSNAKFLPLVEQKKSTEYCFEIIKMVFNNSKLDFNHFGRETGSHDQ
jgi:DNA mismatch repair ATPase MutL